MNASLRWLRSIAPDLEGDAPAIAARLAAYGAPVDEMSDIGAPLRELRIGRVLEVRRHPNADRLSLCTVDIGDGGPVSVVCGAPNVRAGAFYPFAPVGATLPGGMTLRRAKIRGEESHGMLCSARELELGRDHEGVLELHGEFEPGAPFIDATGLDDVRIVVDVTPNRPDLLSHWGLARELAPRGEASLGLAGVADRPPLAPVAWHIGGTSVEHAGVRIRLDDVEGCPRYCAAILRGVRVQPSPEWLAARLRVIGQRPINNIVDASNWVLHELGQPMHAFDLDALGPAIVVRRAHDGETLVTLDGARRTLDRDVLVIADDTRAVALAGIMGGQDSEVSAGTTNVLLECALFDTRTVRRGRRKLDLSTDASQRFERGVDPDGMRRAIERIVALILATAGGDPAVTVVVADGGIAAPEPIALRPGRAAHLLGVPFAEAEIVSLLAPVGFRRAEAAGNGTLRFAVPGHRRYDVTREVDLIEEIARRRGFESFPSDLRPFRPSAVPDDAVSRLEDRLRSLMVGRGFLEARSAPLAPAGDGDVALQLPLSAAETVLRRALLPGLVRRAGFNFNRGTRDVRLFEIGTAFAPGDADGLPRESTRLAAIMTGTRWPRHWSGDAPELDLWDVRGLMQELGVEVGAVVEPASGAAPAPLAPEQTFALRIDDRMVGQGGLVAAGTVDAPVWAGPLFGFEIELDASIAVTASTPFRPLPMQPAVDRDLALVAPDALSAAALEGTVRAAGGPLLESLHLFDVYTGAGLQPSMRSLAFRLRFRSAERTLTDEEVDGAVQRILDRVREEHHVERR